VGYVGRSRGYGFYYRLGDLSSKWLGNDHGYIGISQCDGERDGLLLFLVLNLTACQTWQSVSTASPAQFIEVDRPDRVRVTGGAVLELEVVSPSVESDQLVGAGDIAVPLEDILRLEVRKTSIGRSIGFGEV
jgi:hypothetical protein